MSKHVLAKNLKVASEINHLYYDIDVKEADLSTIDEPTHFPHGFPSEYFAVYGSLRAFQGNFSYYLQGNTEYVKTVGISGFKYVGSLSSYYTGNPEDITTMDLFRVKKEIFDDKKQFNALDAAVDSLEGCFRDRENPTKENGRSWYKCIAYPMELEGKLILPKIYSMGLVENAGGNGYVNSLGHFDYFENLRKRANLPISEYINSRFETFLKNYPNLEEEFTRMRDGLLEYYTVKKDNQND